MDVYVHRELLYMLMWRDIKIKYKQSIMGFMWAILMPIIIVGAGLMVRYAVSVYSGEKISIVNIAAISVKAVPWAFFVASVRFSTLSLISNSNLVTKIYFPRELFPISSTLSQFFDFLIASVVIFFLLLVVKVGISVNLLWLPLIVISLFSFSLGLGILLSALALFFRDVKYLVEVGLTFGIFFTPVFYDIDILGEPGKILALNPLSGILQAFDTCIVRNSPPDYYWFSYSLICSLLLLLVSAFLFKKMEPAFAENI